ncbi:Spore coat-associated protein N [Bacillus sp. 349Y]|nr:Spore coat-associated protein N [Bacillus sp. 349Y]
MGIKQKLGLGAASAVLGLSLIGGGTYAYFSDTAVTNNTFAAGTLDLSVNPTTIIDVKNIKPGDWMNKSFVLKNDGTLDIKKILLQTSYKVKDKDKNYIESKEFGKHIRVNFLYNEDKALLGPVSPDVAIFSTTLYDLQNMSPDVVSNKVFVPFLEEKGGLKTTDNDKLVVQFEFVDKGDQNEFQGQSLELNWTFEGKQGAGVER